MLKPNLFIKPLLLAVTLSAWSAGVMAERVRYVSDQLVITLRAGQGDQYKSLRTLVTGTRLEILEEQGEFARVRIPNGEEGWVRTQYLLDALPAKQQLKEVSDKLARYEQENRTMREQLNQLKQERTSLQQQADSFGKENKRLADEHARISESAQRPMELEQENRQLKEESEKMKSELDTLRVENSELKDNTMQKWFLSGGGVLLIGILLGVLLPKLRGRRQSMWS